MSKAAYLGPPRSPPAPPPGQPMPCQPSCVFVLCCATGWGRRTAANNCCSDASCQKNAASMWLVESNLAGKQGPLQAWIALLTCSGVHPAKLIDRAGAQPSIPATSLQVQMIMREASAVSPTGHAAAQVELFSTGAASQPAQALHVSLRICPLVQC